MKYLWTLTALCCFALSTFSQTQLSGIVNKYSKVNSLGNCANKIVVSSPGNFTVDEEVIIHQTKGAVIDEANSSDYGNVTNWNSAGLYEVATVKNISGDTLTLEYDLVNTYDYNGVVQLVTFPKYNSILVSAMMIPKIWDGEVGGVIAIQSENEITLNGDINVSGYGFKGGAKMENPGTCSWLLQSPDYAYANTSPQSSNKGEGIAVTKIGKEFGRGAQANGGGGGNDHNSGGGGGANYAAGGLGGQNMEPDFFGCKGENPGAGGKPVDYTVNRIVFGGGGGAGHGNNNFSSRGGDGGGVIIIKAKSIVSNGYKLNASGTAAFDGHSDGAGGGGAGGTILLDVLTIDNALGVDVSGGKGGSTNNDFVARCFGPGGGGSGGLVNSVSALPSAITPVVDGGAAGTVLYSSSGCQGSTNGAQAGGAGGIKTGLVLPTGNTGPACIITSAQPKPVLNALVFPNPTFDQFTINSSSNATVIVFDVAGKQVDTFQINNKKSRFGLGYSVGTYFIALVHEGGRKVFKVQKTK